MTKLIYSIGYTEPYVAFGPGEDAAAILYHMLTGSRAPDEIITNDVDGKKVPYLCRWFIKPKVEGEQNVYLHLFMRSDFDRALHDHPWDSASILLHGQYLEHLPDGPMLRKAGDVITRTAKQTHRIELIDGKPTWSLFITGPKYREWGFDCPGGWTHWTQFVA